MSDRDLGVGFGVACGKCGVGPVLMATCDHFRGTGHEWVIVSICMLCRNVWWIESGCQDCLQMEQRNDL